MQVYKRCTMFVLAHILGTTELRQCTGTTWNIWIEVTNWEFSTIKDLLYPVLRDPFIVEKWAKRCMKFCVLKKLYKWCPNSY